MPGTPKTISQLEAIFVTGAIPTQQDYYDFFASFPFYTEPKAASLIFAGPSTGAAAAPTFRSLVAADIPDLSSVYQVTLVSGTNIKTINSTSLLGSGNISIVASSVLSGLTAATGTNTINNASYTQEWQWNTLGAGTGLLLSSSATDAASNTQTVFRVNQTGANASSAQTTYAGYFSNTKTGTTSTNVGLYATASGGSTNHALLIHGTGTNSNKSLFMRNASGTEQFSVSDLGSGYFRTKLGVGVEPTDQFHVQGGTPTIKFTNISGTTLSDFRFEGGGLQGNIYTYSSSNATYPSLFALNATSRLGFMVGGTLMGEWTSGLRIGGTIITTDAILDLQSTTKAFIPPRMTTVQKNAITTPSQGMEVFDTDLQKKCVYTTTGPGWETITSV